MNFIFALLIAINKRNETQTLNKNNESNDGFKKITFIAVATFLCNSDHKN